MNFKELAKSSLDEYENKLDQGYDDPDHLNRVVNLYKQLHIKVYETEDNYTFNSDIVDQYLNCLVKHNKLYDAIEARQRFIKYMVKTKTVDHQMRRAYLEIVCLHILVSEKFKVK